MEELIIETKDGVRWLTLNRPHALNALNAALVEAGWAVAYGGFDAQEAAARKAGRGAWAGTFERPDRWRATHGGMAEPRHDVLMTVLSWLRRLFGWNEGE